MNGFFPLKTPADLREKLRRDMDKVRDNRHDPDVYFNFFVTAEALADWVFPGKDNRAAREALRDSSPYLQVCSHLASGAKHLKVEAKHHKSVTTTGLITPGVLQRFPPVTFPLGMFPDYLGVILDDEMAEKLGKEIAAEGLAYQIFSFWERYPLDPSEQDDPWFNPARLSR